MACTTFGSMLESGNTQERESKGQNTRCPCSFSYTFTAAWGFQSCTCADGHWLLGENSGCLFLKSEKKKQGVKQHGHSYGESTTQEVPDPGWGQAWLLNLSPCLCFYVLLGICNRGLCLAGGTPPWKQHWESRFSIVELSLFSALWICIRLALSLHCWHATLGGSLSATILFSGSSWIYIWNHRFPLHCALSTILFYHKAWLPLHSKSHFFLVLTRLFMCNSGVSRDLPIEIDGSATRGHAISFSGWYFLIQKTRWSVHCVILSKREEHFLDPAKLMGQPWGSRPKTSSPSWVTSAAPRKWGRQSYLVVMPHKIAIYPGKDLRHKTFRMNHQSVFVVGRGRVAEFKRTFSHYEILWVSISL